MTSIRFAFVLALATLAPVAAGCAADTDESDSAAESEDAVRAALLKDVAAVKLGDGTVVAAPSKVKRVLENVGLQRGAPAPRKGALRCFDFDYELEFLDAAGATKGKAGFICGSARERKDVQGSIQAGGKSYLLTAKDIDALEAIGKEPLAVGDVLFGADKVTVGKPMGHDDKTYVGADIVKLMKAIDVEQVPDPKGALPKCIPSRVLTFEKKTTELASVGLNCSEGARGLVTGAFTAGDLTGAVKIDAGIVFDMERATNTD